MILIYYIELYVNRKSIIFMVMDPILMALYQVLLLLL